MATNADIGAAKALFFPTFSLSADAGSTAHDFSNIADKRAAIWSVSGGFLQPIFQAGAYFGTMKEHKAQFDRRSLNTKRRPRIDSAKWPTLS